MNDPVFPAYTEQAQWEAAAESAITSAAAPVYLNLVVSDAETTEALLEHQEGRARAQFALTALKVGVLALRAARGTVDAAAVRGESERLLGLLGERLEKHRELVDSIVGRTLANYFDPRSGHFSDRVARLVAEDGELASVIQRKVTEAGRGIDEILGAHLGQGSPLLALLSPGEGNQLVASIRATLDNTLKAQSDAVLSQFSLDNEGGALRRLLTELAASHGDLQKALAEQVEAVVDEFSLDKADSALSRLVAQVQKAQQQISSEFSLDNQASGLSRLARLVHEHNEAQRAQAQGFQDRVLAILERIDARRAEQARSTTHGRLFEEAVGEAVRRLVQPAGDVFEVVSSTTGKIARSKTGDFVVTLSDDCAAPGARIVVEAKEDASYKLATTLEEAEVARANRDAGICLFVHSRKSAPAGLEPFARYGQNLVVVWDAEDEATDVVLQAAITCARALSVRAARRSGVEAVSMQKIDQAVLAITKQIEGFDEIRTSAGTVTSAAQKIDNRARIMAEQITRQTEALTEQMAALKGHA
jgi:hypothetical protein